jgi:type III secretory pathway lipoprotein EscJ
VLLRLAPSAAELRRERSHVLEQTIARLCAALHGVTRVEVSVQLPAEEQLPLDRPLPRASVSVVAQRRDAVWQRDEIERIVLAQLPMLQARDVAVVESAIEPTSARKSAQALVPIGPFRVHPASARGLRASLALLLASNALLASVLLWRTRRSPSIARKVDRDARSRFPP